MPKPAFRRAAALAMATIIACGAPAAQPLPDLGGAGDVAMSPQVERRLGENIVREIRYRDPGYVDDPEVAEYLGGVGARLARGAGGRHEFEFFLIRDPSINAFALPGGFIGVHTGLVVVADTESELASVIAHEMAHVTQRHIARIIGQQKQMQMPMMVALAAALLLGNSRPDLATGAAAAIQAGAAQAQLSYSRDFEREADRVGLHALEAAGFDARAMASFFDKMQRTTRVADDGRVPGYMRSHPLTVERIADAQNKAAGLPYRQHLDSLDFHLVRAKIRAESADARDAVAHFQSALRDRRFASEAAARFGLAVALLRNRQAGEADAELERLRAGGAHSPMIESQAARAKRMRGDDAGAAALLERARARWPHSRPLVYAQAELLQDLERHEAALGILADAARAHPRDARIHRLRAKSYAATGRRLLQHQAQAEHYALEGTLPAAIEQLQLARAAGDGDFYQLSAVEARLNELRALHAADTGKPPPR